MTTSTIQTNLQRLLEERAAYWEANGKPLADIAQTRDFTEEERTQFSEVERTFAQHTERIRAVENSLEQERSLDTFTKALDEQFRSADKPQWYNTDTGERAALEAGQSIRSHPVFERVAAQSAGQSAAEAQYGDLGSMVRAMATGGTGSALVPTVWAGDVIDLARAKSVVVQSGATIIPMQAGTVKIGRKTGDPTTTFRAEGSTITPSDPTFDAVTLEAKTIAGIVVASLEWWQDVENSSTLVVDALAQSIASQIDLAALYGGIESGAGSINLETPPNPRGILAALNANLSANVLGGATNGTVQTAAGSGNFWAEVIQSVFKVKRGNEEPNALIWNSALAQQYAGAVDTTGQPLAVPPALEGIRQFETNRIPNYTQGTMSNRATDLFAGDFSQLLIGQRLDLTIKPLPDLYAGNGQIGVMAVARIDTALARNTAFAVYRALQGAA
jgi:HK97 family phage major capsid protein